MRLTTATLARYFKRYIERELYDGTLQQQWKPLVGWKSNKKKDWEWNYTENRPWTDDFKKDNPPGKRRPKVFVEPIRHQFIFKGDRVHVLNGGKWSCKHSKSLSHVPNRGLSLHTANQIPEGTLLGLGNPLLDITITANESFLQKYELEPNNAILAKSSIHYPMFDEMMSNFEPQYIAGGATQNTIRVAQWLLKKPFATTFFGCVGGDKRASILQKKALEVGVNVKYQVTDRLSTGVCGAVITGENRSLVTDLGAANFFTHSFLENPENWKLVEKAQYYYIGGFVFPVCTQSICDIAEHSWRNNKTLVMNLSAPFLCKYFTFPDLDIMSKIDILFGNETEAETFCKLQGLPSENIKEMAHATAQMPMKKKNGKRIVIFTQGREPTIVAHGGEVMELPTTKVDSSLIKDTNGCGDAFVGGFLSQLVQGKPLDECLKCGQYAARTVIQHFGCVFPENPEF